MTTGNGSDAWEAAQEGAELLSDGEYDKAIEELIKTIETHPRNEYAYYFLGNAYFEKQELERAMAAYVKALEFAPNYLGAMVGLGHTLRLLGKLDQALKTGHELLRRDKHDADGLYLVGLVHVARGDHAAGLDYLRRFIDTKPEAEVAYEAQALIDVLTGQAVEGDPEN